MNPPIYLIDTQAKSNYFNAWHHFAGTYNSATGVARLYVDGVVKAEQSGLTGNLEHSDNLWLMFTDNSGQGAVPGRLDDVRIYNRALNAAEIQALAGQ